MCGSKAAKRPILCKKLSYVWKFKVIAPIIHTQLDFLLILPIQLVLPAWSALACTRQRAIPTLQNNSIIVYVYDADFNYQRLMTRGTKAGTTALWSRPIKKE